MFLYFVYTLCTREWAVNDGFHELRLLHWAIDLGWRPSEAVTGIVIGFFTADSLAFIESQEKKHHNKSSKQTMGGIGRARKQVDEFVAPNSVTQEPEGRGGYRK